PRLRHWEWHYLHRLCQEEWPMFPTRDPNVRALAFSPDGRYLAYNSGELVVREYATGKVLYSWPGWIDSVCFSPDSRLIAAAGSDILGNLLRRETLKVREVTTGKEVPHLSVPVHCKDLAFSGDGKSLFRRLDDGTLQVVDVATGQVGPPLL